MADNKYFLDQTKGMKVLIVDDEQEICLLLRNQLKKFGLHIDVAYKLRDAEECLQDSEYDLVFLDIHLPDGNGLDMVPVIRSHNSDTRIVVISAYNSNFEQKKAQDLGVYRFLGKPFSTQMISEVVHSFNN